MFVIILFLSCLVTTSEMVLYDFHADSDLSQWRVVDDVVMGGRSNGRFEINEQGNGVFYGNVSLENNGGFSSIRYQFQQQDIAIYDKVVLTLKGDGKKYQFRIKSSKADRHTYIYHFQTTQNWETIEIPLNEMKPGFRGIDLAMPEYDGKVIEEIAFLISNKKDESFKLELDQIMLK